jgi:hypothetical protein
MLQRGTVSPSLAFGLTLLGAVSLKQPAGAAQVLLMGGGTSARRSFTPWA